VRPAPRGVPQIEVAFDIDANGILNVSAKDKETGKEQNITISGSTSLDKGEIDRMIRDAESHAAEDKMRRQEVEQRNHVDSLVYQVERRLGELQAHLPVHTKARAEQLVTDARAAIKEQASTERLRTLASDLEQMLHSLSAAASQQAGTATGSGTSRSRAGDDVVDAEFTEKR
jgi:molecular chaperone DnaK